MPGLDNKEAAAESGVQSTENREKGTLKVATKAA